MLPEAGATLRLSDGHEHVLIYWAVHRTFGLVSTVETRLKDKPGVDMAP